MIKSLENVLDWEKIFEGTGTETETIIFKSSHRCPISMFAKAQFKNWAKRLPSDGNLNIYEIDVIFQREISKRIAEDTNIQHQSPQIIWLNRDRTIRYHLNHTAINVKNLIKCSEGNYPVKK